MSEGNSILIILNRIITYITSSREITNLDELFTQDEISNLNTNSSQLEYEIISSFVQANLDESINIFFREGFNITYVALGSVAFIIICFCIISRRNTAQPIAPIEDDNGTEVSIDSTPDIENFVLDMITLAQPNNQSTRGGKSRNIKNIRGGVFKYYDSTSPVTANETSFISRCKTLQNSINNILNKVGINKTININYEEKKEPVIYNQEIIDKLRKVCSLFDKESIKNYLIETVFKSSPDLNKDQKNGGYNKRHFYKKKTSYKRKRSHKRKRSYKRKRSHKFYEKLPK